MQGSDRNLSRNRVASLVYICANAQDIGLKHYCALDTTIWTEFYGIVEITVIVQPKVCDTWHFDVIFPMVPEGHLSNFTTKPIKQSLLPQK